MAHEEALAAALKELEKEHGKGVIMKMSDRPDQQVNVVSTRALTLDIALGIGGLPLGRTVEVYGPESSGKTTLALTVVAEAQKQGGRCAYIDAEHALDPTYAEAIGVKTGDLYICQPDYGEQGLNVADTLIKSGAFKIIVIDSVPAMTPRAEIEGDMGDSHVGLQARLFGQAMRKLTAACSKADTMLLLINQLREKIGVLYGSPEVTSGGRAIRFYASVRLDVRKVETYKVDGEATANRTRVKVVKNKLAPPFRQAEFEIVFGKGISEMGCLLDVATDMKIVERKGAWYSYKGANIAQGRVKAVEYLEDNSEVAVEIRRIVGDTLGIS